MDDFAWENDLVCFRIYGPAILKNKGTEDSGVDCWPKRVNYPIINRWYLRKDYHIDHGEGHDNYHVGASRGCGGTALWIDGKLVTAGPYKTWNILSQTPEKSSFEITYEYQVGTRKITELKRFSIQMGQRLYKSESTFTEDGKPARLQVAIGVTTHDGKASVTLNPAAGWMSCWEVIDNFGLGTGVVIDPHFHAEMLDYKADGRDKNHALAILHTDAEGKTVHYAGFAWEKAGTILTAQQWQDELARFAASLN